MNFKMRAETHYYQPKKVRNTKCPNPMRIYFSACLFSNAAIFYWETRDSIERTRALLDALSGCRQKFHHTVVNPFVFTEIHPCPLAVRVHFEKNDILESRVVGKEV